MNKSKYIIGFVNLHEMDLEMKTVDSSESSFEIGKQFLEQKGWELSDVSTVQDLKNFAGNCDCIFNIINV